MRLSRRLALVAFMVLALSIEANYSIAQEEPPPPPPPGRDDGPGGRGNPPPPPEQRIQEQLRTLLEVNDAEWGVLQPKIDHIQVLIRERDRFTRPKPPPPPRPDRGNGPDPGRDNGAPMIVDFRADPNRDPGMGSANAVLARSFLNLAMLASRGADGPYVLRALEEYREARAKSDAELAHARADLRDLVTSRQEMILVVVGILE